MIDSIIHKIILFFLKGGLSKEIPLWNIFSPSIVRGVMDVARDFLADEGFLVTLCLAQHIGEVIEHAVVAHLRLHRTWTLMCCGGYRHPDTLEEVNLSSVSFW